MDESYVIEKGVPIPPPMPSRMKGRKNGYGVRAIIQQMDVGDSVVVDQRHRFSLSNQGDQVGVKIVSRLLEDGRVRVWVTERTTPVQVLTEQRGSAIGDRTAGVEPPRFPPAQAASGDSASDAACQ